MNYSEDQLIEALYKEYLYLCHDDFDPDEDMTPEEYLEMLKEFTYEELLEEMSLDEEFTVDDYMSMYGPSES